MSLGRATGSGFISETTTLGRATGSGFVSETVSGGGGGPPLSYYYLGADQTDGNWTKSTGGNVDLFSMVDETTPDTTGADYIQSAVNPSTDVCELKFSGVQTPSAGTDHTVSYIIKRENSTPLRVDLINANGTGDKIVNTWNHTGAGDTIWTRYDRTFTPADGVGIAVYSDLRIRFTAG